MRVASPTGGFDLVPANRELAGAEVELVDLPERETRLKDALAEALPQMRTAIAEVAAEYDFILIDCPPSLSLLTLNGLCAADSVLIPMQCEYYALEGLSDLVQTIKKVRAHLNPSARDRGPAAHHVRPAQHARAAGRGAAREALRRQGLPHHGAAQRAPGGGAELRHAGGALDPASKGAQAYLALAGEMLPHGIRQRDAACGRRGGIDMIDPRDSAAVSTRCSRRRRGDAHRSALQTLAIDRLQPGKYQPRTQMDDASLDELAASIHEQGVMQPILVRPVDGGRYEIIAGERRWRAAQRPGCRRCRRSSAVPDQSALRAGADREHPARGPQPARGGARPRSG